MFCWPWVVDYSSQTDVAKAVVIALRTSPLGVRTITNSETFRFKVTFFLLLCFLCPLSLRSLTNALQKWFDHYVAIQYSTEAPSIASNPAVQGCRCCPLLPACCRLANEQNSSCGCEREAGSAMWTIFIIRDLPFARGRHATSHVGRYIASVLQRCLYFVTLVVKHLIW